MDIRKGTLEDIPAFEYLDNLCFPATFRYNRFDFLYYFFRSNVFSLVAEDLDGISGFLIADTKPPNDGHIVTIDVHPQYRKKGVGKALMHESEKIFRNAGAPKILLEVHEDNMIAQIFYSKLGFKIDKRLDNYYFSGNGLRLVKKL